MMTRWLAFTLCAVVAAGLLFGGRELFVFVARPSSDARVNAPTVTLPGDLISSRGNDPPPSPVPRALLLVDSSRFQLVGVIAPGDHTSGTQGVALVSIDGKPAQAFKVGAMLSSDRVLQAILSRSVLIGPPSGAAWISLELAEPGPAANANLGSGRLDSGPAAMQPRPSQQPLIGHPPAPQIGSLHGSAPNVLMNNPADMAPADASGKGASPSR